MEVMDLSSIYLNTIRKDAVYIAKHKGFVLAICKDMNAEDPRAWDNLGRMVCFHTKYELGDTDHGFNKNDFSDWEELRQAIIERDDPVVIYPLYLFDHSGITIKIGPFSGPDAYWDSGQVGYIYTTKEDIRNIYGIKRVTQKYIKLAEQALQEEVELYDKFLRGEVYGYILEDEKGNEIDSCWGFYGWNLDENGIRESLGEYAFLLEHLKDVHP